MKISLFIFFISFCFFSCTKKCGECYVVEFEADGVTVKQKTLMGEYCGSDAKQQAEEKAIAEGITCSICHVECN